MSWGVVNGFRRRLLTPQNLCILFPARCGHDAFPSHFLQHIVLCILSAGSENITIIVTRPILLSQRRLPFVSMLGICGGKGVLSRKEKSCRRDGEASETRFWLIWARIRRSQALKLQPWHRIESHFWLSWPKIKSQANLGPD